MLLSLSTTIDSYTHHYSPLIRFSRSTNLNLLPHQQNPLSSKYHKLYESSLSTPEDDSNLEPSLTTSKWTKIKAKLGFKEKNEEKIPFRQKLSKMGLSAVLSYGFVSNLSYCVTVSLAWYIHSSRTKLSPLAPGQWKPFLAIYAGFYVFNNIIRPFRLAASVAVSTYFDKGIAIIQDKVKCSRGVAIALLVFLTNICGTCSLMALGIFLASLVSGVPLWG